MSNFRMTTAIVIACLALSPLVAKGQSSWISSGSFAEVWSYNDAASSTDGLYAVGYISSAQTLTLPGGITLKAPYSGDNALIVKYKADGTPAWARTVQAAKASTVYLCVAAVPGAVYAIARCRDPGSYDFGDGAVVETKAEFCSVLVRYGSDGKTHWAKTLSDNKLVVYDMASEGSALYLAGEYSKTMPGQGGSTIVAAGTLVNGCVLKMDLAGKLLWANGLGDATLQVYFNGIAAGGGKVYACGTASGKGSIALANGSSLAISSAGKNIGILVCLDAGSGSTAWVGNPTAVSANSSFMKVAICASAIAVVGTVSQGSIIFDSGVTASSSGKSAGFMISFGQDGKAISGFSLEGRYSYASASELSYITPHGSGFWLGGLIKSDNIYDLPGGMQAVVENYQWTGLAFRLDASGKADRLFMVEKASPGSSGISGLCALPSGALFLTGVIRGPGTFSFVGGLTLEGISSKTAPYAALLAP